jgi:putative spermidine/putrescine transport system permease protein
VGWSLVGGGGATAHPLLLGTMAAFAVARYRFFGREVVGFVLVLPIALPGIVTGIALNSAFSVGGVPLGYLTVVVGHATFCVVVVYNNVLARLRRTGTSLEEASMDLGADTFSTFRRVTFPQLRSALLAGALLAFALSFDEIVVTTFTTSAGLKTLPIWVFENLFRPNSAPIVNVVAAVLILLSILPIWAAQKLSGDTAGGRL